MTVPIIGDVFRKLAQDGWQSLTFEPLRDGIELARLFGQADRGASGAVLRYQPGASAPRHRHPGFETVIVLDGAQSDEAGTYVKGDVVVNPPGSIHTVTSETGCIVLIVWEKPVEFVDG
jgi:anti-sigma factor ChrR (cupin superfamily)